MKGGGTEIERLLTFEKNSFTESKNHDLIFKFTIQNWGNSRCVWQLSPKAAICCIFSEHLLIRTPLDGCFFSEIPRAKTKNVEHHYGKLLRNLIFKVLISQFWNSKISAVKFKCREYFCVKPLLTFDGTSNCVVLYCSLATLDIFRAMYS